MKKILFIHHGIGLGGAPQSLLFLVQNLDRSRYQPTVLFLHDSDAVQMFEQAGITIAGIVGRSDFSHTAIWWYRWYHFHHLLRAIKDFVVTWWKTADWWFDAIKPDMVHLNTSTLAAWALVAHRRNIPIAWHIREPLAAGYFGLRRSLIQSMVARYANAILPICQHDAHPWQFHPATTVLYNAVDQTAFHLQQNLNWFNTQYHLDPQARYILYVGGLSVAKGAGQLFKIMQRLRAQHANVRLLVAGYFVDPARTRGFLRRWTPAARQEQEIFDQYRVVADVVNLLGPIRDVPAAMQRSTIIVFPAIVGHFARPIIEAGMMARPVIASPYPPLDELVIEGVTGHCIDPYDIDGWIACIAHLLGNPAYAAHLGQNGRQQAERRFDIHHQIDRLQTVYHQLLQE